MGILLLFAAALATSGILRLAPATAAFAEDLSDLLSGTSADKDGGMPVPKPQDVAIVLAALQEREAVLDEREHKLAQRLEALSLAEDRVSTKLQELTKAEETLAATMAIAKTAAADDLSHLTTLYENMKPKQAIPLFEAMDPSLPQLHRPNETSERRANYGRSGSSDFVRHQRCVGRAKCRGPNTVSQ